jgi:hypothetical protein
MTYAQNTSVSVEKSRAEIERILERYGATRFGYGWDQAKAVVQFETNGRQIRFELPLPDRTERRFTHHQRGKRTPESAQTEYEKACRQRWRALVLVVKAKLEAVESGVSEFEDEFLAHIVLPDGSTAGQWMRPQIERAYQTGGMPTMLALGSGDSSG